MEKLTIEHLAPYLPYGLKYLIPKQIRDGFLSIDIEERIAEMTGLGVCVVEQNQFKPILRPLSELPFHSCFEWFPYSERNIVKGLCNDYEEYPDLYDFNKLELTYDTLQELFKNHFDVFGLIEKGLAIDINTLDK